MSITYEQIKEANESIVATMIERKDKKTGKVTSKAYAEVNQRIKAFRMVYPDGVINTDMMSNEDGVCIFRAVVYARPGVPLASGTAFEKQSASYINQTSYIENCETSAVGRALGYAGFGVDTSIASKEEVENAMKQQEQASREHDDEIRRKVDALELVYEEDGDKPLTDVQYASLLALIDRKGITKEYLLKCFPKVKKLEDLTQAQGAVAVAKIDDIAKGYAAMMAKKEGSK